MLLIDLLIFLFIYLKAERIKIIKGNEVQKHSARNRDKNPITEIKRMKKTQKEKHNRQIIKDLQKCYEVVNCLALCFIKK